MVQKKRRYKRLAFGVKVNVYRQDKNSSRLLDGYLLEAKNITEHGIFLRTNKSLPIGTILNLEIVLAPGSPSIYAEGKVAWIADRSPNWYFPGIGVELINISVAERRRLKGFLRDKFKNYRHAVQLKKIYLQLKAMESRLYELEESHPQAEHFKRVIDNAIKEIDHIAHIIDREVWEVKRL